MKNIFEVLVGFFPMAGRNTIYYIVDSKRIYIKYLKIDTTINMIFYIAQTMLY